MNLLENLEIYIPGEAEVKNIHLWSLPKAVLKRIGLPLPDVDTSKKLAESPEGIWICPAVLRRKGQKKTTNSGNGVMENTPALLGKEFRDASGPFQMSFVVSNQMAYKVLKEITPGKKISRTSHNCLLPVGSAPRAYQHAVVIYRGHIYLSIRHKRLSQQETRELQPATNSTAPSTLDVSSKKQKRQAPQASVEPADKEPLGKRRHVTLSQVAPKRQKDLKNTKTDQENVNRPKKKVTTYQVTRSENRKDVTHEGRDALPVPQSADSASKVDGHHYKDQEQARGLEQEEKEEVNNDSETQDLDGEEAKSSSQNDDVESNTQLDGSESDNTVGVVEQSSNQSWMRREPLGAAPSLLQQQYDFSQLEQEEMIALMKAKLRQCDANVGNLSSK